MQRAALDVFAAGRLSGQLQRSDIEPDTFLFGYAEDCPASAAVSLTMPVVRDQYDSMGRLHPIFEMNLPEDMLRERLQRAFGKAVQNFDDLALLSIVGRSQIGRLRYAVPGAMPEEVPAQSVQQLLAYRGAEDLFGELIERFAAYSGVSGMQPKVLIRDAGNVALDRLTHKGATHIVKAFNPAEFAELAANEFFCMEAARLAGIPVPKVLLSEDRRLLIMERFDLAPDDGYLGVEDFCVLNGMRSSGRYDASYELIAKRIKQFVSPAVQRQALEQFFAMLALSCAVENGDAHLKNFAVLYRDPESEVRLAPAYDIVSTTPYQPRDMLALTLAESKRFPDKSTLVTFGRRACDLPGARVTALLRQVVDGVVQAIGMIRAYAKKQADFEPAAARLTSVFERGMERSFQ
jgi:serine/threonine-protein kinase HipA